MPISMVRFSRALLLCLALLFVTGARTTAQETALTRGITEPFSPSAVETPQGNGGYCSTPNLSIPDDTPAGVTDTLVVGDSGALLDMNVSLDITHTWVGNLRVTLTHQDTGTSVMMVSRPGVPATATGCSGDNIVATLDDEAATGVENECGADVPTIQGSFIPNNPLSAIKGEDLAGTWMLQVSDYAPLNTGTLDTWCLLPTAAASLTIVKEAVPADGADFLFTSNLPDGVYLDQWGEAGSADGQFSGLRGVAVGLAGNVYVADSDNHRIQKFDSNGTYLSEWGSLGSGNGRFNSPWGVAADGNGSVYVADTYNHRIQKFDSTGNFLLKWGSNGSGDGQFDLPSDVAVDGNGNVYVADTFHNRIQKFDSTGNFLLKWGSLGSGNGEFILPWSVSADAAGNVYMADWGNHRIQKFDSSGNFQLMLGWGVDTGTATFEICTVDTLPCQPGIFGSGDGQFARPEGVGVDTAGNVYVADSGNDRVQKFTSDGLYLAQWGSNGNGDGEFNAPRNVAMDAAGYVFVADSGNNRIQKFTASVFSLDDAVPDDGDSLADTHTFSGLLPGSITITETLPGGWSLADLSCDSGSWSADLDNHALSVILATGEDVTCTFSNVEPAILTIIKDATPADGTDFLFTSDLPTYLAHWGEPGSGDEQFNSPIGGMVDAADSGNDHIQKFADSVFSLDDAVPDDGDSITDTHVFSNLPPDSYSITEILPGETWVLDDITCNSGNWNTDLDNQTLTITLAFGDDITCTFFNANVRKIYFPILIR